MGLEDAPGVVAAAAPAWWGKAGYSGEGVKRLTLNLVTSLMVVGGSIVDVKNGRGEWTGSSPPVRSVALDCLQFNKEGLDCLLATRGAASTPCQIVSACALPAGSWSQGSRCSGPTQNLSSQRASRSTFAVSTMAATRTTLP